MRRSRFTEEQVIAILRDQEAGMPTAGVCRRHGISRATFGVYSLFICKGMHSDSLQNGRRCAVSRYWTRAAAAA